MHNISSESGAPNITCVAGQMCDHAVQRLPTSGSIENTTCDSKTTLARLWAIDITAELIRDPVAKTKLEDPNS